MKKLITALMVCAALFASTIVYSQDSTRAEHKLRKVAKKSKKGKHDKAMKKAVKMGDKEDKGK